MLFVLLIYNPKEALLVLKIMFPTNGKLSGTHMMHCDSFFLLLPVSPTSLLTGQFFMSGFPMQCQE